MVLYQLICITGSKVARPTIKEIAKTAGNTILNNGGVVREIQNLGIRTLPKPIKKYQATFDEANYFIMSFDSNRAFISRLRLIIARVQKNVSLTIKLDPRVLRHSIVKLGDKLDDIMP